MCDTSATFGPVRVTLDNDGGVSFAFGNNITCAAARISKSQAKIAKAYLVKLAKGAKTAIIMEPATVTMYLRYFVKREALACWNDIVNNPIQHIDDDL